MDKQSKSKSIRSQSSKKDRAKSTGQPRLTSQSSQQKSIEQMIQQNDQKLNAMKSRRRLLKGEMEQTKKTQEQSQFKQKTISRCEQQIQMIEEGISVAQINRVKLTRMWMAELINSNVIPEFQEYIKEKTEMKKEHIGSKMKKFVNEDQEQE